MGYILSKLVFWAPANYDDPDPTTGITPRQKDIVKSTWNVIRADAKSNGIKLFVGFFETYPDTQKKFAAFADVPLSELPKNKKLLAHVMSVMYALSSIVDNLNDPECLVEILRKVGTSHRPRNIKPFHFQNLTKYVVDFLVETLGSDVMDERAKEAWHKSLDVANGIIISAMEEKDPS